MQCVNLAGVSKNENTLTDVHFGFVNEDRNYILCIVMLHGYCIANAHTNTHRSVLSAILCIMNDIHTHAHTQTQTRLLQALTVFSRETTAPTLSLYVVNVSPLAAVIR